MATLAEQLESALEGTGSALSAIDIEDMLSGTATSIKPGTVTPITSQQSNQVSWKDVFNKIGEGIALKPGEGLPEVPKNIPASTFYRTATQSGKLPAGASQFFTKPLDPETPTTALTTTPTITPTTTTSTTSVQNVGRQLQEAFDLQDDGGLQDDSVRGMQSVNVAVGDNIVRSFDTLDQYESGIQNRMAEAYDAYEKGDPTQLEELGYSPDMSEIDAKIAEAYDKQEAIGPSISFKDVAKDRADFSAYAEYKAKEFGHDIANIPSRLMTSIRDGFYEPSTLVEPIAKGFAGSLINNLLFQANPLSGFMMKPVLDIMFSEGQGQIGTTAIVSEDYWNPGSAVLGSTTVSSVHGFAQTDKGVVAVDIHGNILAEYNPQNPQRHGLAIYGFTPTIKGQEKYDAKQAREDKRGVTVIKGGAGGDTLSSDPYGSVDEQAAAAQQSAAQNLQEAEQGYAGQEDVSDDPSGDKIICTMMNRMYGLGNYRAKQWLLYSNRYLTPEHQLGYHKLYCKLVSMMPSNKVIAKVLSHIANKRTDDIVAEMKGTRRSWLGRLYRATLIDTPSYVVGLMIKRNWLKPANISILN